VRRVLTPAQRDTLEVMRAERERRERERRGGRGAGRYPLGLDGR
jgi:hypothetical protein